MIHIRQFQSSDSISLLTDLLHRAYRPLAEAGMRYEASYQDEEATQRRIDEGICFVAEMKDTIVAAIVYCPPGRQHGTAWYQQPGVASVGQFAVEPALQGGGIGSRLLQYIENRARAQGAIELALDTSIHARHLIDFYLKRGYREVERVHWPTTNYQSVVLSKSLRD